MAFNLTIQVDKKVQRTIRRRLRQVANNIDRAKSRAANRTATSTVAFFSKETRKQVNVKAARLKKNTRIRRSRPSNPVAAIDVRGAHIPLTDMGARQTRRGVTVRRFKQQARQLLKSAFISTMPSGHKGVFRRKGKARHPIVEQFGPSVINLWRKRETKIARHALVTLQKEMKRQIEFYRNRP